MGSSPVRVLGAWVEGLRVQGLGFRVEGLEGSLRGLFPCRFAIMPPLACESPCSRRLVPTCDCPSRVPSMGPSCESLVI